MRRSSGAFVRCLLVLGFVLAGCTQGQGPDGDDPTATAPEPGPTGSAPFFDVLRDRVTRCQAQTVPRLERAVTETERLQERGADAEGAERSRQLAAAAARDAAAATAGCARTFQQARGEDAPTSRLLRDAGSASQQLANSLRRLHQTLVDDGDVPTALAAVTRDLGAWNTAIDRLLEARSDEPSPRRPAPTETGPR